MNLKKNQKHFLDNDLFTAIDWVITLLDAYMQLNVNDLGPYGFPVK